MNTSASLTAIELGSGCGIAGIAFAQLWPRCRIYLTDLADAMNVLESNIAKAAPALETEIHHATLDWEVDLPLEFRNVIFDLVLVSECIYNSDTIPALVKILAAIADASPNVLVLISTKRRHSSELMLFELLSTAGFFELNHISLILPDENRTITEEPLEQVQIYQYQRIGESL